MVKRKVEIEHAAKLQLKEACKYIRRHSYQNAENVKAKILQSIKMLALHPERHPPDKYCTDNDENFRAYEIYKYRITYYVSTDKIIVIRIRHTKMNPLSY